MAQSVKRLTLAQVTNSRFVSSSPVSGSVLTAQSPEPASDSVSPSLPLPRSCSVSLCLRNKETFKKFLKKLHEASGYHIGLCSSDVKDEIKRGNPEKLCWSRLF